MKKWLLWLFRSNLRKGDPLSAADGIARSAAWGIIFLGLILFLVGCATVKSAYYPPDCSALATAGEQAACEKGKMDEAARVQKIRENAAYNYGKTGSYSYGGYYGYPPSSYSYWPILNVRIRTWSGYDYRRGSYENYNCDEFMRYTPHCN